MGSHITFTPKISKLDVHLGYVQVPLPSMQLSRQNVVFFQGLMILGISNYEP